MNINEIIESFRYNNGKFQKTSIIEARKNKEEISEALLKELDNVANKINKYVEEDRYILHFYALYLLAEFREKRAFPIITKLITQNQDDVDYLLNDVITEDLGAILASTYDGNSKALYDIIKDDKLDEFVRNAAFKALVILEEYNITKKGELLNNMESMLEKELKNDSSYIMTSIVVYIIEHKVYDKIKLVRKLYDDNRIDGFAIGGYDDFIDEIYGKSTSFDKTTMINDTISSMEWFGCFNHSKQMKRVDYDKIFKEIEEKEEQATSNKSVKKNDPCTCGSGKKYKFCCMNKRQDELKVITPADKYIEKSLSEYPKKELEKIYDSEAISIDEKLYAILKHKAIPLWVSRNYAEEARRNTKNMEEALNLIKEKCEKEKISTEEEYNEKIAIHYSMEEVIKKYLSTIDNNQKEKVQFLIQITRIIDISELSKKTCIDSIVNEYLYMEMYSEAKQTIKKLINELPEMEKYLNSKLAEVEEAKENY